MLSVKLLLFFLSCIKRLLLICCYLSREKQENTRLQGSACFSSAFPWSLGLLPFVIVKCKMSREKNYGVWHRMLYLEGISREQERFIGASPLSYSSWKQWKYICNVILKVMGKRVLFYCQLFWDRTSFKWNNEEMTFVTKCSLMCSEL